MDNIELHRHPKTNEIIPEEWKQIEGYPMYDVSNYGRVRSWKNNKWGRADSPKILKQSNHSYGYKMVSLRADGKTKRARVHRLVAKAFLSNPNQHPFVLHKDDNPINNFVHNLHWGNHKMNIKDRVKNSGKDSMMGQSKLSKNDVLDIRNTYQLGCFSQQEIADAYNVSQSCIYLITNNKTWQHI